MVDDLLLLRWKGQSATGLDPEARRRTWAGVGNLTLTGTTVVLTTHYIDEADHLADRMVALPGGRIVVDTTPRELRAQGGPHTIRYLLPDSAPLSELPTALAAHLDRGGRALVVSSGDVSTALRELVGWADCHGLDLVGLEIGPPSLEDAYLSAIGQPLSPEKVVPHD